jgi:hypothetical protein
LIEYLWRETAPWDFLTRAEIDDHAVEVRQETTGQRRIRGGELQQRTGLGQAHPWEHGGNDRMRWINHLTPGDEPSWAVFLGEVMCKGQDILLTFDEKQVTGG